MSGLVAIFQRGRDKIEPARLETALTSLDHRGPDGDDMWINDAVGMGYQHLQSVPAAQTDDQPQRLDELVVSADVRLDNRAELCQRLDPPGDDESVSDSYLLLAAYREWGQQCVDHLVGAYAFVIWDAHENRLFCARDHFGVKPLYYHATDGLFAVASEPKAILTHPSIQPSLNERKVGDFLTNLFEDEENTFYESIRRLPPAHAMIVSAGNSRRWRYWDLDPSRAVTLDSNEDYARRFRDLFEQAVHCRLRTDEPAATTLSGGLDSSSVTAVAHEQLWPDEPLKTYSGVFEDAPESDEREYIETLVDRSGINSQYVFADDLSALSGFDQAMDYYDAPVHNTMHFMKWEIARRASDDEVGVVLEGTHGDSVVGYGLVLLPHLIRTGRWIQLVKELRAMGDVFDRQPRSLFLRQVLPGLIPDPVERLYRWIRRKPSVEMRANPTLDQGFANRIDLASRHHRLTDPRSAIARTAREWQYESVTAGSLVDFLEANDITHAVFGIEPRYPFLDKRLVEFSLAIPPTQQLTDGWTRMILRRALDDLLPEEIQWRSWKTTMNAAFIGALAIADDQLLELVEDPSMVEPYLNPESLRETHDRFQAERDIHSARVLWRALSLSAWLENTAGTQ
ncbi:asparagine synthase (glutamine-hydrolysing) [Halorientalis persicus]|uniref:Putative asparagine synthetase [glutamine-hydrolyzing] n=1 Tax=Halorientalis persicus TaxID=1367881 RepID=A0A1H8SXP1_9EURY|nr:asparagine synthase (glutamine-hydrolyzing) [Halorientalis persicus]SEO83387.1 asparagine synthase (glutamine-hydrolysing) [Halorientalis persicus]